MSERMEESQDWPLRDWSARLHAPEPTGADARVTLPAAAYQQEAQYSRFFGDLTGRLADGWVPSFAVRTAAGMR